MVLFPFISYESSRGSCIMIEKLGRNPGGGGYSPIKVIGVPVVPFRGLKLWTDMLYYDKDL